MNAARFFTDEDVYAAVAQELPVHPAGKGPRVVYGEACRLGAKSLEQYGILEKLGKGGKGVTVMVLWGGVDCLW